MPRTIEISHRTIIFILVLLGGIWLVLQIRDILYLLFISYILMTALRPLVEGLVNLKIPRVMAVLLMYILIFGGLGGIVASSIPSIASQSNRLIQEFPSLAERVIPALDINIQAITQEIAPITQNILRVGVEVFNNIINIVTILVFTLYLLLSRNTLKQTLKQFTNEETGDRIHSALQDVEGKLGAWARGQFILMVVIGVMVYIGLVILKIEYALPLAVLAGLLELVPMIGPIVSAVPAVLIALTVNPILAVSVAAMYFVIQQFENHLIVPFIMRKAVGFSPIITIVAFMIGARFAGVVGAILAIPAILVIQVVVTNLLEYRKETEE